MKQLMQKPRSMDKWLNRKRREFAAVPES